jgi:hypothetical protein
VVEVRVVLGDFCGDVGGEVTFFVLVVIMMLVVKCMSLKFSLLK